MLNIALPSSGPLYQSTIDFLNDAGISINRSSSRAYTGITTFDENIKIIFQRQSDICLSLDNKLADLGVMGLDRYKEYINNSSSKVVIEKMGYGNCDLVIAVPQSWHNVNNMSELRTAKQTNSSTLKVATKYPVQTNAFFSTNGLKNYEIISTNGAVEVAPQTGLADIIVDISSTGTTIRENDLKILDDGYLLFSQATMISNPELLSKSEDKLKSAKRLLYFISGHMNSKLYNTIIFNIQSENENQLFEMLNQYSSIRGIIGPTIAKVYSSDERNWFSVTIVVSNEKLGEAIEILDKLKAEGITIVQNKLVFDGTADIEKLLIG
jgi:ATP phosphoribosyltransferase